MRLVAPGDDPRVQPSLPGSALSSFLAYASKSKRSVPRIEHQCSQDRVCDHQGLMALMVAAQRTQAEAQACIARAAFDSMSRAMLDSVTSDLLSDAEVDSAVSVADWKGLDVLLEAHQPVLIASGHLGSWELFAEVMARRGHVFSAVVRPLSGAFNDWLVRSRERAGVELIHQRGALRNMLKALRRGRAVVQLLDQALPGPEALWVPFFGRLASTTPALSMAALRSGAPVYVVVAVRHQGQLQMHVEGPVPVPDRPTRREALEAHTAALTAILEGQIRRYPEQWLWLHRRWKGQIASRSSNPA